MKSVMNVEMRVEARQICMDRHGIFLSTQTVSNIISGYLVRQILNSFKCYTLKNSVIIYTLQLIYSNLCSKEIYVND